MSPKACVGCLLGTAVGDALGLPYEGLSPERGKRLFPDQNRFHFVFGKGMVSDDTEHACFVAESLLLSRSPEAFQHVLAGRLRWWLLGLPAGTGRATLNACFNLLIGYTAENSGAYSAGNGPAMRSALIGIQFGHSTSQLREYVRASTELHIPIQKHFSAHEWGKREYLFGGGKT